MFCAPGLGWPLACWSILRGLLYSLPTITFISSSPALLSTQFLSLYSSLGKITSGNDFESLRYDVEEMWPDTQKGEGEDGGYKLAAAEDSDNRESPVGERVGFSESPKGKHPDPEKEIGARGIQREMLSWLEALSVPWEAAVREKERSVRTIDYFLGKEAKLSIPGKWHVGFFMSQKINALLVGIPLSKHSTRWTNERFYREYTI